MRVLAEYGLAQNFALQAVLPLRSVVTSTRYTDLAGNPITLDYQSIHHHDETLFGIGDAQLLAHLAWDLDVLKAGLRFGMSAPFGTVHPNPYVLADKGLPHEHIQLGTGTFDPVIAGDVTHDFGRFSMAGFGQAQPPLYQGPTGYRAGGRYLAGVTAMSGFGLNGPMFRAGLTGYVEAPERWDGVVPLEDGNQGRADLYLGAGATFPFAQDWSMSVDLRSRVFGVVRGAQLSLPLLVEVSLGRLLHLESGEHEEGGHDAHGGEGHGHEGDGTADVADLVQAGELATLSPVPGKWTVIDFWAPWCEGCKRLGAELEERAREKGIAVRRVNIVDFDSPIARKELPGVTVLPHVRVYSPDGWLKYERSGTADELLHRVDALVK